MKSHPPNTCNTIKWNTLATAFSEVCYFPTSNFYWIHSACYNRNEITSSNQRPARGSWLGILLRCLHIVIWIVCSDLLRRKSQGLVFRIEHCPCLVQGLLSLLPGTPPKEEQWVLCKCATWVGSWIAPHYDIVYAGVQRLRLLVPRRYRNGWLCVCLTCCQCVLHLVNAKRVPQHRNPRVIGWDGGGVPLSVLACNPLAHRQRGKTISSDAIEEATDSLPVAPCSDWLSPSHVRVRYECRSVRLAANEMNGNGLDNRFGECRRERNSNFTAIVFQYSCNHRRNTFVFLIQWCPKNKFIIVMRVIGQLIIPTYSQSLPHSDCHK